MDLPLKYLSLGDVPTLPPQIVYGLAQQSAWRLLLRTLLSLPCNRETPNR